MTKDEALKLALEALEYWDVHGKLHQPTEEAITAIKEALAQPEQKSPVNDKKIMWVTYTNTDCTEGRGVDVPIAVCEVRATAKRLAQKRYVQRSDGPVRAVEVLKIDGEWYWPNTAIHVIEPTSEDLVKQAEIDAKNLAIDKAKKAGLTDTDFLAMGVNHEPT